MSDLMTQLRDYGNQLDEMATPLSELVGDTPPRARPVPRKRRGWLIALATGAAVLVFIGGLAYLIGFGSGGETEPIDQPLTTVVPAPAPSPTGPPATAPPTTIAAPSTLAQPAVSGMVWQRIMDDSLRDGVIWDITVGGPGLVAVGVDHMDYPEYGVVWVSSDGHSWDRINIDEATYFTGVVAGPSGVVAFGRLGMDAAMWHSPDGYEWTNVFIADTETWYEAMDVFVGGPGWVAVETDDTPRAFVSEDGVTWMQVEDPSQTAEFVVALEQPDPIELLPHPGLDGSLSMLPSETAVNGDFFVRVNWADSSIWATIDSGESWQETTVDAPVFSWSSHLSTVTAFGNGFVVVGSAGDDDAFIWIGEWMEGKGELE